jgi:hypothetical protein
MQIIRTGTVLTGEYAGWTIKILDDRAGETGGYYCSWCRTNQMVSILGLNS